MPAEAGKMRKAMRARDRRNGCGSVRMAECIPRGFKVNSPMRLGRSHVPGVAKAQLETAKTHPQGLCDLGDGDGRSAGLHQMLGLPDQARIGGGRLLFQKVGEVVPASLQDQHAEKLLEVLPGMRCEGKILVL